jgi:hypothetical protein
MANPRPVTLAPTTPIKKSTPSTEVMLSSYQTSDLELEIRREQKEGTYQERNTQRSFYLPNPLIEDLEKLAATYNISKNRLVVSLLKFGVQVLQRSEEPTNA